jgi:1,4-dihydroxy-2-naphthoate polyprenyltransferase
MYIFWPLLLGQALAMGEGFSWEVVLVCHFYGLASQLYIVFANDVADMATDRRNFTFTLFSGGSRVLVDGLLTGGSWSGRPCCAPRSRSGRGVSGSAAHNWLPLPLILFGLALLWAYSYPPLRCPIAAAGNSCK